MAVRSIAGIAGEGAIGSPDAIEFAGLDWVRQ